MEKNRKIKIYVCGPTVYSKVHIGNLKPILTFDIFTRSLTFLKKKFKFIHNITDVDDKIIAIAQTSNKPESAIAQENTKYYLRALDKHNIKIKMLLPKVTNNLKIIKNFILKLIKLKYAYQVKENVYFEVSKAPFYGLIANRVLEKKPKANDQGKRHPADFALWKKTTTGIQFNSQWGLGRPGWHTECAALVDHYFKSSMLDFHGGGVDLKFPHNENENVQFQVKNNFAISKHFIHLGLLYFDEAKMSKSHGNVLNALDFAEKYGEDTFRMIILNSSLTAPINLTEKLIKNNVLIVTKLRKIYLKAIYNFKKSNTTLVETKEIAQHFTNWDFATAMSQANTYFKNFHKSPNLRTAQIVMQVISLMGFCFSKKRKKYFNQFLLWQWKLLRKKGNYTKADQLRKELQKKELI